MSSGRFRAVRDAVAEARKLEGGARRVFLAALAPEIRAEVESLLRHDRTPANIVQTGALARGVGERLRPALEEIRRAGLPETIGPYRLGEVLGEGGMGVVFRAEQTAPIRREVALKLLRQIGDPERVRVRFESELQSLAAMNHPGIAKVFDAGVHEGRPFFAMELVPGEPATTFCETHALDLRERLRLFVEICDAVRHAHQRGVIHRDIKPSNVLVGEADGTRSVKVIDFGIALAAEAGGGTPAARVEALGTPAYMSPEQAARGDGSIDTRSDVYSLGVLLYELLTSKLPFEITADTTAETLEEVASRGAPDRPSRVAANRALAGDLDAIVLRAVETTRERRYESVAEFADDVTRYLGGHPVRARGGGAGYRFRKLVGRHPVRVAAAAIVVVLLVGFTATTAFQSRRITEERNRALAAEAQARTEAQTAQEVLDFLVGVFDVASPRESGGEELRVRDVLDTGVARIREELVDQPAVRARLQHTLAEVYHGLGAVDRSIELVEEALEIRRARHGLEDPEVAESIELLATLAHDDGDYERAITLGEQAVAIREALAGRMDAAAATALAGVGSAVQALGKPSDAEPYFRRALEVHRATLGEAHPEVAWDLNVLGWSLHAQGRLAEARPLYEEAMEILRAVHGERHPDTAGALNNLAGLRMNLGDARGGEAGFREALAIYRALYGDDHAGVARAHANYAWALSTLGRYDEAITHAGRALEINRRVLGDAHPYTAATHGALGRALAGTGRLDEAEAALREGIAVRDSLGFGDHPSQAAPLRTLCGVLRRQGRYDDADRAAAAALDILARAELTDATGYAEALVERAHVALDRIGSAPRGERSPEAPLAAIVDTLERAVELLAGQRPEAHWNVARARVLLALGLIRRVESSAGAVVAQDAALPSDAATRVRALALATRGHRDLEAALGPEHPWTAWAAERVEALGGPDG